MRLSFLTKCHPSKKEHIKFPGGNGEGEPPVEAGGLQAEAPWMAKAEAVPWERVGKATKNHSKSKRAYKVFW